MDHSNGPEYLHRQPSQSDSAVAFGSQRLTPLPDGVLERRRQYLCTFHSVFTFPADSEDPEEVDEPKGQKEPQTLPTVVGVRRISHVVGPSAEAQHTLRIRRLDLAT